ncbi:MAG: hypothetical protein ACD_79C00721G0005 [uncultured bacterium]|nr:MAG: hypothetical protein ACD_79C00721G0005 [uncultured bacterium]
MKIKSNIVNYSNIINRLEEIIKKELKADVTGHDRYHSERVLNLARFIAKHEKANIQIIEIAAILHDLNDWKFKSEKNRPKISVRELLHQLHLPAEIINSVCDIIDSISFKGSKVKDNAESIEAKIVQDADRLDALGAIGIARAFAYGGYKNRKIYDPDIKPVYHKSFKEYKSSQSHTINHFYEKLLLLKDRLHTKTAKKIAAKRHKFLVAFLNQFLGEWNLFGEKAAKKDKKTKNILKF